MNRVSTEEVLNKAYRLAYFLHQDKGMAIRIVAAATLKLNVAMAVQSKRLYYVPVGGFRAESRAGLTASATKPCSAIFTCFSAWSMSNPNLMSARRACRPGRAARRSR